MALLPFVSVLPVKMRSSAPVPMLLSWKRSPAALLKALFWTVTFTTAAPCDSIVSASLEGRAPFTSNVVFVKVIRLSEPLVFTMRKPL